MKTRSFLLAAGVVLALALTFASCSAHAAGQSDFYGVWVQGSNYFEINKEAITKFKIGEWFQDGFNKEKYRIVKWEKVSNKNFVVSNNVVYIVYTLSEEDKKIDFQVSIDAYSDLHIYGDNNGFEGKKSSAAELNKAIKEIVAKKTAEEEAVKAAREAAREAGRGSFSDKRDGKIYKTVKIVSQTWMSENLNYNASGSKCYDNEEKNCQKYGRLYDWSTAKKSCPSGWHLPNNYEWQKLVDIAGGDETAGATLKAASGWKNDGNGTDEFGFSALPGGGYFYLRGGSFGGVGDGGLWWIATEHNANYAYYRSMYYDFSSVNVSGSSKSDLRSVRCLQD